MAFLLYLEIKNELYIKFIAKYRYYIVTKSKLFLVKKYLFIAVYLLYLPNNRSKTLLKLYDNLQTFIEVLTSSKKKRYIVLQFNELFITNNLLSKSIIEFNIIANSQIYVHWITKAVVVKSKL